VAVSEGKLVTPEQFALEQIKRRAVLKEGGNGHLSASLRREQALVQQIQLRDIFITHLKAVLVIALEQRGGVPLLVLMKRRNEVLEKGSYNVEQDEQGNVTYSLAPPEPETEPGAESPETKPEEPS
jgi:hypothetical protein